MGNTLFFESVKTEPTEITWKEILSESKAKHRKEELEYAMTSGMATNKATEEDMLRKWHKPWVFRRVATYGLIFIVFLYAVYFLLYSIGGLVPAIELLTIFFPPIIIPLSIVIFLWEMNMPKNLSIIEVLMAFIVGGVLSIAISMLINVFVLGDLSNNAMSAALSEEPGKFIASLLLLLYFSLKGKKKIYGITGVIVGAAVGSGFSAFETVQYMFIGEMSSDFIGGGLSMMLTRLIGSFGNHTVFCAIYSGAFALALGRNNKKFSLSGLFNSSVWLYFVACSILHAFWNGFYFGPGLDSAIRVFQVALQWYFFLKIVNRSLNQMVLSGTYQSGTGLSYEEEMGLVSVPREVPRSYGYGQPVSQPVQPSVQPMQPIIQPVRPVQPVSQPVQPVIQPVRPVQPVSQPAQPAAQPIQSVKPVVQPEPQHNKAKGIVMEDMQPLVDLHSAASKKPDVEKPILNSVVKPAAQPVEKPVVKPNVEIMAGSHVQIFDEPETPQPHVPVEKPAVVFPEAEPFVQNKSMPQLRIECVAGALRGQVWSTRNDEEILIGRGESCTIKFSANTPAVSRKHCKLIMSAGSWYIVDLNSVNGTFVNNQRLISGSSVVIRENTILSIAGKDQIFNISVK